MRKLTAYAMMVGLVTWVGCDSEPEPEPQQQPTAAEPEAPAEAPAEEPAAEKTAMDPAAQAKQIYDTRCTTCHGPNGKGEGPGAKGLPVQPRDYTDAEWQKQVTDEEIAEIIVKGGAAVGKSQLMPPNPDLQDKPEVVDELVKIIRGFGPSA